MAIAIGRLYLAPTLPRNLFLFRNSSNLLGLFLLAKIILRLRNWRSSGEPGDHNAKTRRYQGSSVKNGFHRADAAKFHCGTKNSVRADWSSHLALRSSESLCRA